MLTKTLSILSALTLVAVAATAADKVDISKLPPAATKAGVTYDKDIKAIFEASCFKCHGAEKQKGKLRLDTYEATMKGGEDGAILEKATVPRAPWWPPWPA